MATTVSTGLRIVGVRNQNQGAKDPNDEWVCIDNEGNQRWDIAGCEITDQTATQKRPHVYKLPKHLYDGSSWTLDPGERLYLRTGHGQDQFIPDASPPQFHFYWNRDAFVWNNTGDHVYLRGPNGEFLTQPHPTP